MKSPSPPQDSLSDDDLFLLEEEFPEKKERNFKVVQVTGFVVSAILTGTVLLATAGLAVTSFFHHIPFIEDELSTVEYPVEGRHHTVLTTQSQWLHVDSLTLAQREGKVISNGMSYIPELTVQISPQRESGKLRVFFKNEEGKLTGDPITLIVKDGVFEQNGQSVITLSGSTGFTKNPQYYAYLTAVTKPWSALLLEGPLEADSIDDYEELLRVKLQSTLK